MHRLANVYWTAVTAGYQAGSPIRGQPAGSPVQL